MQRTYEQWSSHSFNKVVKFVVIEQIEKFRNVFEMTWITLANG
jgi:hypothetical protein